MLNEAVMQNNDKPMYGINNDSNPDEIESVLYAETKETRERKFETKEVIHHQPFTILGKKHTHAGIYIITYSEERTVKTYKDGTITYTNWTIVQGSQTKEEVRRYQENGWTEGYVVEITKN